MSMFLPKIGTVQAVRQPRGSLDSASRHSAVSRNHDLQIEEGDLVTGIVDIAYERAYMMSAIRDSRRSEDLVRASVSCCAVIDSNLFASTRRSSLNP